MSIEFFGLVLMNNSVYRCNICVSLASLFLSLVWSSSVDGQMLTFGTMYCSNARQTKVRLFKLLAMEAAVDLKVEEGTICNQDKVHMRGKEGILQGLRGRTTSQHTNSQLILAGRMA